MQKFYLHNGYSLPCIAFGTGVILKYSRNPWLFLTRRIKPLLRSAAHMRLTRELHGDMFCSKILNQAYQSGYSLFDTARIYGFSEKRIGSLCSRHPSENILVITKISDMDIDRVFSPATVAGNLKTSLMNLHRDYVDCYLLHYPHGNWLELYAQMTDVYRQGLAKSIGICNCGIQELKEIERNQLLLPMVCQVEMHPFYVRQELRDYCAGHNIQIMAHTPTARMSEEIRNCSVLKKLAEKYQKSVAQVIMRWHHQSHIIPVISTFNLNHMEENLDIWDFSLSDSEMNAINRLDQGKALLPGNGIDDPRYVFND